MNSRQRNTLKAIFSLPTPKDMPWRNLESLLLAVGSQKIEMSGSRVRFEAEGISIALHKPHNPKTVRPYQIILVKNFLEKIGVNP